MVPRHSPTLANYVSMGEDSWSLAKTQERASNPAMRAATLPPALPSARGCYLLHVQEAPASSIRSVGQRG